MALYHFNQNNSGGTFVGPRMIVVDAPDAATADAIATKHGVYFDGVRSGRDCECCGPRWYRSWDHSHPAHSDGMLITEHGTYALKAIREEQ